MGDQGHEAAGGSPGAWQLGSVSWDWPDINRFSDTAPYVQVADLIEQSIRSGDIAPGDRLPSIKDIVDTWAINKETAAKSLRLLKARGAARLSSGMGYYAPSDATAMRPDGDGTTRTHADEGGQEMAAEQPFPGTTRTHADEYGQDHRS